MMLTQNQIVLSIGSNLGNRLENIQLAINAVHKNVGTVIQVSKLYETVSWGFESNPFYNAAVLIHCNKTPLELLEYIHDIEKSLGRKRTDQSIYEDRFIDVDIVCINEKIINTEILTVPHTEMHKRLFVLIPFQDLNFDWKHPLFNKNISGLIATCEDTGVCKLIGNLQHPLQGLNLDRYNYIAIEGNIGAGKTTLTNKLAADFNAKTVLERFADNPFLPKFYQDQNRYAFSLEMSFLADRYQQLSDDLAQFDLFKDFLVADYHIFKSLIFAKVTLADDEFRLYKNLFDIIYKDMKKPDLYIYLYQNSGRLIENIKKRGRVYEQDIKQSYLDKINQGYLDYIKSQSDLNVLTIDVSDRDFVSNQSDYIFVLEEIKKKNVK
jgi:2-amino-4-hydroxy-6-hydroxymethyldihydropteridine diphosphokinase